MAERGRIRARRVARHARHPRAGYDRRALAGSSAWTDRVPYLAPGVNRRTTPFHDIERPRITPRPSPAVRGSARADVRALKDACPTGLSRIPVGRPERWSIVQLNGEQSVPSTRQVCSSPRTSPRYVPELSPKTTATRLISVRATRINRSDIRSTSSRDSPPLKNENSAVNGVRRLLHHHRSGWYR